MKKKKAIDAKILLLGLDNAGKTTILKALAKEDIKTINPTKGFNVKVITLENVKFVVWDLGGQMAIRNHWENYYKDIGAIIFVIDSSDEYRLEESGNELRVILEKDELSGVPLLILANKQDLRMSLDPDEIIKILELDRIKNRCWNIIASSAVRGIGLMEGFKWLKEVLNSQV